MNLTDISTVRSLMNEFGINFQKKFGQNFLINPAIPQRIADESGGDKNDCVLEIGPGIGTLTAELCRVYSQVLCIEIDDGLIPVLGKTLEDFDNVRVINGDIMKFDIDQLAKEFPGGSNIYVCANLPYYITTPVIMKLLESKFPFGSLTLMVQKEVAARLTSAPGTPEYGAITASVSYYGEVKRLFKVPAGCFMPAPKVDSAVIQIVPHKIKPVVPDDEEIFFKIIKGAFGMRRKTLCNCLATSFPQFTKEQIATALTACGISPDTRGETLSIKEFCIIANIFLQLINA